MSSNKPLSRTENRGIYAQLGVRTLINAAGTYTTLSGSIMLPEVIAALEDASKQHVEIEELQQVVGKRIAALVGVEAALVTSGCAAALTLGTAACVYAVNKSSPEATSNENVLKNQVILQKSHRFSFDRAIRNVGVELIEVETVNELNNAINERTGMLFFLNFLDNESKIGREEFARIANRKKIPALIDAAADLPPARNLHILVEMGYDLAAFSGGKGLCGPQSSGLLIGREELIKAAYLNGPPHEDSVGRIGKVSKEGIVGLLKAIELYLQRDHAADWREWEHRVDLIRLTIDKLHTVRAEPFVPKIANEVPHLAISWDPQVLGLTRTDVVNALRTGEPRIEVRPDESNEPKIEIAVWMLQSGEAEIVARRCFEVLGSKHKD